MQRRLITMLVVLTFMLAAVPLVATAAAPNLARISAVSYQDMAGNENNSLCAPSLPTGPSIKTTISYSGTGAYLGGNGTGTMSITLFGPTFELNGQAKVNGKTLQVSGAGSLSCLMPGYAMVTGNFNAYLVSGQVTTAIPIQGVSGSLTGYISDGVHKNQGSVSLMLREEAVPPPTTTSLDVSTTLDGTATAGVMVALFAGGVCGVGIPQPAFSGPNGIASFNVTGETQYCASADPNADTTPSTILVSVPVGDPVDVDAIIAETAPIVTSVDVLVTLDGFPADGVTVTFYADGTCTSVLGTAVTSGAGVASLVVAGTGTYCASADPNVDLISSNTGPMTIDSGDPVDHDGTIAETTPLVTSVDVLVTLDGVAAPAGVTVTLYSDSICTTPAFLTSTDAAGVAKFPVTVAGTYCATADPNADTTVSNTGPMTIALGDPVDTDGTIAETTPPVISYLDILVTLDGVTPQVGETVILSTSIACDETVVYLSAITDASGIATFALLPADLAGHCAHADPNGDLIFTEISGGLAIPLGDPTGDTDYTIDEATATFLDVVVTFDGVVVGAGVPVTICYQITCVPFDTVNTDANGRATFVGLNIQTGHLYMVSANPNSSGPPTEVSNVTVPLGDPAGDTDATIADVPGPGI